MSAENIGRVAGKLWAKSGIVGKVIFYGGIITLFVAYLNTRPIQKAAPPPPVAAPAPPDPAIAAAKLKKELAFQRTVRAATLVKKAMREPDSLVWESLSANEDASVICLEYRARNGFGGMNREFAVIAEGSASQKASAWNKHCTKPMVDMSYVRYAVD